VEYAQCKHKNKQEQQAKDARIKPGRGGKRGGGGGGDVLFVEVNAVVVLTTGVTATGGVLATSADAALTHRCLTTLVACVLKS